MLLLWLRTLLRQTGDIMESRLTICVVILALVVDGGRGQLDVCGVTPLNQRIVGGSDALAGSWPWMASLYYGGSLLCGGTLINDMWILTAAQCVDSFSSNLITVSLGRLTLQGSNPNEVSRSVAQIIKHGGYDSRTHDNDIALLKLSSSVPLTNYTRPVCLAADSSVFSAGRSAWITGWGRISTGGPLPHPETLKEADVPVVSNKECRKTYAKLITDNKMCAGQGRNGVCVGDGGGPLVVKQDTRWIQAGVMSFIWAEGCAQYKPDGYTRVSRYQSWIKGHIASNQPGFVYSSSNVISGRSNVFSLLLLTILPLVFCL